VLLNLIFGVNVSEKYCIDHKDNNSKDDWGESYLLCAVRLSSIVLLQIYFKGAQRDEEDPDVHDLFERESNPDFERSLPPLLVFAGGVIEKHDEVCQFACSTEKDCRKPLLEVRLCRQQLRGDATDKPAAQSHVYACRLEVCDGEHCHNVEYDHWEPESSCIN